jgi:fermentation-respiration switch protein FrsA (DUF1100 family)
MQKFGPWSVVFSLIAGVTPQVCAAAEEATPFRVDHDAPLNVKAKLVERTAAYSQFRVEFNGIAGKPVPAFVYVPGDKNAKHPAVLLQYGSGGNKSTNYIVALAKQFASRGFLVLTIDVPGRGERREPREGSAWSRIFQPGTFVETLGDYSRAVDYLNARPDVDTDRIGYAGISLGAITGLTFVAHEPRVRAMASIVGGANFLGSLKIELDPKTRESAARIDPFYHVSLIAPRPLLLLNATQDQLVPRFFGEQLHKAAGDTAKKVWVETDHFFNGVDRFEVMATVIDFLEKSLPKAAKTTAQ